MRYSYKDTQAAYLEVPRVLPLCPDDTVPVRKARTAELHDLWCKAGFSVPVMIMLLDQRRGC